MNVSASTVRKSSRAVSLGFAAVVVACAAAGADATGGAWMWACDCVARMLSMLPWWANAAYGFVAFIALLSSAGARRLKWGVAVSGRQADRVTVWGVLFWAALLPAEVMMLLVAWPFLLGRLTVLYTRPDGR